MQKRQNRFKLVPEVYKEIKISAKELGNFQKYDKNGKAMFEGNGHGGKKPLLINHEVEMCAIYQKDGRIGLNAYIEYFKSLKNKQE